MVKETASAMAVVAVAALVKRRVWERYGATNALG
jgi:hypothetical protein